MADSPSRVSESQDFGGDDFQQRHDELVPDKTWWWAANISMSIVALIANVIFLVTVIYNRKRHQLKTFVSAVIITIAVLDVLDVLRVVPVLVEEMFLEEIFRHVFCSFGVFHELAVAIFLVALGIAICVQSGKETKYYTSQRASLAHKILVPLVLLICAGAAAPFFLLSYDKLSYTCTDPMRVLNVVEADEKKFESDLYSTFVTVFTYILPILVLPIVIPIASVRTCINRQCCVPRFKQPIGELIMVTTIAIVYLGTVVAIMLPRIDQMLELNAIRLPPAPLLWQLGNDAVRPLIYFLTNPAVGDGLQVMCCKKKNQLVNEDDEETEVPLSPVTTV